METEKAVETVIVGNYVEMESEGKEKSIKSRLSNLLWHGGSVYDAWFSCASNQVLFQFFPLPKMCHVYMYVHILISDGFDMNIFINMYT